MTHSVVNYINAHGGLGGRKIQLVTYDLSPNAVTDDASAAYQAACAYFTQDHKVTAITSYAALAPDSFYQCLANAHVPIITPDEGTSAEFFRRFPNTVYMPPTPNYSRLLADSVDALWNAGWLTAKSRVGIVGFDTPNVHDIVNKGLVPALARHGLKLAAGMYTGTTTAAAGAYGGGVLSFKSKLVDRVFFAPGGQPIYFALAAQLQGYHPRYELGSLEYPTPLAANLPADQLAGSMGLDWLPYLDLPSNKWSTVKTPGIAQCRKAMASAHQDFSSGTTLGIAAWICDDWMFLKKVFDAGASPDEAGIRRAAETLGDSFKPASTFRTTFSPGRTHDGASGYRMIAFNTACKCYAYTTGVRPLR
jgi:ABC-type branched-subunit amino acid transport system substrate-binding protein